MSGTTRTDHTTAATVEDLADAALYVPASQELMEFPQREAGAA